MKKIRLVLTVASLGLGAPLAAQTVVNFHDAHQGYTYYGGAYGGGGYSVLMYGQGALSDSGNNVWNGFGEYPAGGPGSEIFYGPGNPDSGHGAVPNGNPGNPYAWYNNGTGSSTSASGTNLFSPTSSGATNAGNATSAGAISPVTLSLSYNGGDNGIYYGADTSGVTQGTPSEIFSEAALVTGASVGTFTLSNVPALTCNLFLYGANFDGTRGATFTVSSGTAVDGFTSTTNPNATPGGPLQTYVLGVDYVEFINVTPNADGKITGTWSAVTNPNSGLSGEGDFNGLQLQIGAAPVPEPTGLPALGLAALALLLFWQRRRGQSAS